LNDLLEGEERCYTASVASADDVVAELKAQRYHGWMNLSTRPREGGFLFFGVEVREDGDALDFRSFLPLGGCDLDWLLLLL
jgi:hypothetical protein